MRRVAMADMAAQFHVELFADRGLPYRLAAPIVEELRTAEPENTWNLEEENIPLCDDGGLDMAQVQNWSRERGGDATVILTELPRRDGHRPQMAEIYPDDGLIVISLPALGWIRLPHQLRKTLLEALAVLRAHEAYVGSGVVHECDDDGRSTFYVSSPWWRPGRIRLVLGMVRTNEPLTTAPKLSSALAAAGATGAFGIFYSSIWSMADALPNWRLATITAMTIVAMVGWLILSNDLWERRRRVGSMTEAAIYNASTVVTLLLVMGMLYALLFVIILFGSWVVIDEGFLAYTIGEEIDFTNYIDIAWLSASMGTIAGALGANFDNDVDIRRLTHGRRRTMRHE